MAKTRRRARLAPEAVDEPRIAREGRVQNLDRDLTVQDGIVRAEDLAHPARGDTIDDVVAAVERPQRANGIGPPQGSLGHRASGRVMNLPCAGELRGPGVRPGTF